MKRMISALVVALLVLLPLNSYAVIPVVAYAVETGVPIAAELIVANAERTIISRIATNIANNPIAWASAVSTIAQAAVSYRTGPASNPTKYEIPATVVTPVPRPAPVTVTTPPPGWTGPSFFNGGVASCSQDYGATRFNVGPAGRQTLQGLADAYNALCPGAVAEPRVVGDQAYLYMGDTGNGLAAPYNLFSVSVNCPPATILDAAGVCKGEEVDGTYRFNRGPYGFTPDLSDPDWNNQIPSGWLADGHAVSLIGSDANGKPIRVTFTPTGGGTQVTVENESTNALGSPTVTQGFMETAGDGTVVNSSLSNTQNSLNPGPTAGAMAVDVTFPDGMATEQSILDLGSYQMEGNTYLSNIDLSMADMLTALGTTNSRLNTSNTRLNEIKTALTAAGTTPGDPAFDDHTGASFKSSFNNGNPLSGLLAWNVPEHLAECPTAEFNALGTHFVFDSHCDFADQLRVQIQALFAVIFTLAAFFIVIGA